MSENSFSNLRNILEYIWIYSAVPYILKAVEDYKFLENWSGIHGNEILVCHVNSILIFFFYGTTSLVGCIWFWYTFQMN